MQLGLVEGFYGPPWSQGERRALLDRLAAAGYGFWHYTPKADRGTRDAWREPWPEAHAEALRAFAGHCRAAGVRFGVGITPLGLDADAPASDWRALADRLAELDAIGIEDLLLGFDDIRGDKPDLAKTQAGIADWAAARTGARRVLVCPTYYSDDPLLDRLFGERPAGYLDALGHALDARIDVYWAGEEICPREIPTGHVERVAETLRRRPVLWDNYPVNDGERSSAHLHLRGFTGRPTGLRETLAGHAINPALQPTLTAIPALTLAERYRRGEAAYAYMAATRRAARLVLGDELAEAVIADLALLADAGRDRLGTDAATLRRRYSGFDHPGAREIVRWLDGAYAPDQGAPGG